MTDSRIMFELLYVGWDKLVGIAYECRLHAHIAPIDGVSDATVHGLVEVARCQSRAF